MQFSSCFLTRRLVSCSALLVSPLIVFCSTASAQQSDAVDVSMDVTIIEQPVSGLEDIEIVIDLGGDGEDPADPGDPGDPGDPAPDPPPPVDPDEPPVIESEFCLFVPTSGIRITITGQNSDGGTGFFIESDSGHRISYVVELVSDDPAFGSLAPFQSGVPKTILQTPATDDRGCSTGDNAQLKIDFSNIGETTDFKVVIEEDLVPGQVYRFTDVLTLEVEQIIVG